MARNNRIVHTENLNNWHSVPYDESGQYIPSIINNIGWEITDNNDGTPGLNNGTFRVTVKSALQTTRGGILYKENGYIKNDIYIQGAWRGVWDVTQDILRGAWADLGRWSQDVPYINDPSGDKPTIVEIKTWVDMSHNYPGADSPPLGEDWLTVKIAVKRPTSGNNAYKKPVDPQKGVRETYSELEPITYRIYEMGGPIPIRPVKKRVNSRHHATLHWRDDAGYDGDPIAGQWYDDGYVAPRDGNFTVQITKDHMDRIYDRYSKDPETSGNFWSTRSYNVYLSLDTLEARADNSGYAGSIYYPIRLDPPPPVQTYLQGGTYAIGSKMNLTMRSLGKTYTGYYFTIDVYPENSDISLGRLVDTRPLEVTDRDTVIQVDVPRGITQGIKAIYDQRGYKFRLKVTSFFQRSPSDRVIDYGTTWAGFTAESVANTITTNYGVTARFTEKTDTVRNKVTGQGLDTNKYINNVSVIFPTIAGGMFKAEKGTHLVSIIVGYPDGTTKTYNLPGNPTVSPYIERFELQSGVIRASNVNGTKQASITITAVNSAEASVVRSFPIDLLEYFPPNPYYTFARQDKSTIYLEIDKIYYKQLYNTGNGNPVNGLVETIVKVHEKPAGATTFNEARDFMGPGGRRITTRRDNAVNGIAEIGFTSSDGRILNLNPNSEFRLTMTVRDQFTTNTIIATIPKFSPLINIGTEKNSIGFHRVATADNAVEFENKVYAFNGLNLANRNSRIVRSDNLEIQHWRLTEYGGSFQQINNLNTTYTTGFYKIDTRSANVPDDFAASDHGVLIVYNADREKESAGYPNRIIQQVYNYRTQRHFIRYSEEIRSKDSQPTGWSPWKGNVQFDTNAAATDFFSTMMQKDSVVINGRTEQVPRSEISSHPINTMAKLRSDAHKTSLFGHLLSSINDGVTGEQFNFLLGLIKNDTFLKSMIDGKNGYSTIPRAPRDLNEVYSTGFYYIRYNSTGVSNPSYSSQSGLLMHMNIRTKDDPNRFQVVFSWDGTIYYRRYVGVGGVANWSRWYAYTAGYTSDVIRARNDQLLNYLRSNQLTTQDNTAERESE